MKNAKEWIQNNIVVLFFGILCIAAYIIADQSPYVVCNDLVSRILRNSILVLALIIPIMAGMGLNFSITVGAMIAQGVIIFMTHWGIGGIPGILMTFVLCTVVSVLCGALLGMLFNHTKGQEMITGMVAGYFGQGIYLLIFLVMVGTVIPFCDENLSIATGIGVKDTLNMQEDMSGVLDRVLKVPLTYILLAAVVITAAYYIYAIKKNSGCPRSALTIKWVIITAMLLTFSSVPSLKKITMNCKVPMATLGVIIVISAMVQYLTTTKLGQDFRSVGNDLRIAQASGINAAKVRTIATICSTVLASWGQFVFLQNMGTFSTYTAQTNVGTYSIAALLVGGATVDKANIKQAFIGVFLFQLLFLLAPSASTNLFHDTQIGEYIRAFISYGVIAVALVLHAVKKVKKEN